MLSTADLREGKDVALPPSRKLRDWSLAVALAVLAVLIAWFLRRAVVQFLSYDPLRYGEHLWQRRLIFLPHFTGAALALFLGLTQFWLGLTGRHGAVHRWLGRLYLLTVAVGCVGGCVLAAMSMSRALAWASGFFFMGCAWATTTGLAFFAIRQGAIREHREWMLRSYVIALSFVSFRLFGKLLDLWKLGSPEQRAPALAWISWVVPLFLLESLLQLRRLRALARE